MRYWFNILIEAYANFSRDDGWAIASHVALSGLLALFPFLLFATSVASLFELRDFAGTVTHLIFDYWPPAASAAIAGEVEALLTQPRRDILTIGGLLTIFFASNGVEALRVALNRCYRVKETRPFWRLRLESFGFVMVAITVLIVITLVLILMPLAWQILSRYVPELSAWQETLWFWRILIAVGFLTLSLFISHLFLPSGRRTITDVLPGIAFTLILWTVGSIGFGMYLERFADYVSTYAGLAGAMIGLIFLYMLGAIFIFGAEINAAYAGAGTASGDINDPSP